MILIRITETRPCDVGCKPCFPPSTSSPAIWGNDPRHDVASHAVNMRTVPYDLKQNLVTIGGLSSSAYVGMFVIVCREGARAAQWHGAGTDQISN